MREEVRTENLRKKEEKVKYELMREQWGKERKGKRTLRL